MELLTALKEILTLAKELKVGLLLGTCFKNDRGQCFNQVRIYSPDGEFLGVHRTGDKQLTVFCKQFPAEKQAHSYAQEYHQLLKRYA